VIVFKDINETKNRHQYASQVVIFTNDLEKLTFSWKYFCWGLNCNVSATVCANIFLPIWCIIIKIDPFTYRGARFSHLIAQFCVTFAQFQRYLHIPALLDIHGVCRDIHFDHAQFAQKEIYQHIFFSYRHFGISKKMLTVGSKDIALHTLHVSASKTCLL
jgi:hypothetical protein